MIVEIIAKDRETERIRKIREEKSVKSMFEIEELLRKIQPNEVVIEVLINAIPLL